MAEITALNAEIASRVRVAAKAAGVTQEALALQIGMADRTLARFLTGNAAWKVVDVAAVADALGLELHDLLMGRVA